MSSPVLMSFFDLPWTPVFIFAIFIFHPWMGWLAVGGGLFLVAVTLLNQVLSKNPTLKSNMAVMQAERTADQIRSTGSRSGSSRVGGTPSARWTPC